MSQHPPSGGPPPGPYGPYGAPPGAYPHPSSHPAGYAVPHPQQGHYGHHPYGYPQHGAPYGYPQMPPAPKKSSAGLLIGLGLVALLVVGAGFAFYQARVAVHPEVRARVEGPYVIVHVSRATRGTLRVGEHETAIDYGGYKSLVLPAEEFGKGSHDAIAIVEIEGDEEEFPIAFDVPASALEPSLVVHNCFGHGYEGMPVDASGSQREGWEGPRPKNAGGGTVKLHVGGEHVSDKMALYNQYASPSRKGPEPNCMAAGDGIAYLTLHTNFDAKIEVDGSPIEVDDGVGVIAFPIADMIGGLEAKDGEIPIQQSARRSLSIEVVHDGETLESEIEIDLPESHHVKASLDDAVKKIDVGKPLPWTVKRTKSQAAKLATPALYYEKPFVTQHKGERASFRERLELAAEDGTRLNQVGLVAVGTVTSHEAHRCTGYMPTGGAISAPRVVVMLLEVEVVLQDLAGEEIARKTFARPKLDCPMSASALEGNTAFFRQSPAWSAIETWIDAERTKLSSK